jgi:flagellar motor switch protein FliG
MFENDDEKVNGPRIAAQILKNMKPSSKEKIVKAIEKQSPRLAKSIAENLFRFDDITELTAQGIQTLVKEVDHDDLVLSLKLASDKAKAALLNNMSDRKRGLIESDLESMAPVRKSDAEEAQKRILAKLEELRSQGLVRSQATNEVWV